MFMNNKPKTVLVTGAAGFIGFHLSAKLLKQDWGVVGVDVITDYYDPRIKNKRLEILKENALFTFHKLDISKYADLEDLVRKEQPDEIIHLAAQAGVRYSLTNPWAYLEANELGTLNIFEVAKKLSLPRVVYASSSSVYGANKESPMRESDRVDQPISIYATSKRSNELLAYSYHHLYGFETIGLRFFTVYGIWGRPDLALFKFVKRILAGEAIDVYNEGKMKRSFTHVSDIVGGIISTISREPAGRCELYNLGGAEGVPLLYFIELIERELGQEAKRNMMPLQMGDVPDTIADCSKAQNELGYIASMSIEDGIAEFVAWFRENEDFLRTLHEPKQ